MEDRQFHLCMKTLCRVFQLHVRKVIRGDLPPVSAQQIHRPGDRGLRQHVVGVASAALIARLYVVEVLLSELNLGEVVENWAQAGGAVPPGRREDAGPADNVRSQCCE